jgi:hypothetical protein
MVQLRRIFFTWVAIMVVVVALFAVFGPQGKEINLQTVSFETTQSASLYFKNMRSYFYDKEVLDGKNYTLYRIDSREKNPALNKLSFVIVNNPQVDQCFIRAESGLLNLEHDTLAIEWKLADSAGIIQLKEVDSYAHYIFAAKLFEKLDAEADLILRSASKEEAFKESEKKSLRKNLADYFRLVGKLKY